MVGGVQQQWWKICYPGNHLSRCGKAIGPTIPNFVWFCDVTIKMVMVDSCFIYNMTGESALSIPYIPICEPWCWNMNPNICPNKITQCCRWIYQHHGSHHLSGGESPRSPRHGHRNLSLAWKTIDRICHRHVWKTSVRSWNKASLSVIYADIYIDTKHWICGCHVENYLYLYVDLSFFPKILRMNSHWSQNL